MVWLVRTRKELRSQNIAQGTMDPRDECSHQSNCFMVSKADMIFVQNFTQPDFQAKSFTPQKCVICDIFLAN